MVWSYSQVVSKWNPCSIHPYHASLEGKHKPELAGLNRTANCAKQERDTSQAHKVTKRHNELSAGVIQQLDW